MSRWLVFLFALGGLVVCFLAMGVGKRTLTIFVIAFSSMRLFSPFVARPFIGKRELSLNEKHEALGSEKSS